MAIDYELTSIQTKKTQQNSNLHQNSNAIIAQYFTPLGTHSPRAGTVRKESSSV